MAHPLHHAESSARKFGGAASDYEQLHTWFDATKEHLAHVSHRAIRHHAQGIYEAERVFGLSITNTAGRQIPVRWIGEQHVREDCGGRIPTLADWMRYLSVQPWMSAAQIEPDELVFPHDPREAWIKDVRDGRTLLGFKDWLRRLSDRENGLSIA